MAERILYVYGVVPATASLAGAPPGLDDTAVVVIPVGDVAALASELDPERYAPAIVEARAGEVGWVGPRAVAHDAVLSWASGRGAVVPFPMFTLYRAHPALEDAIRSRGDSLGRALERVTGAEEYAVRLFRLDDVLKSKLGEMSERIAELERSARAASPGQRYLLERKADAERATEMRRVASAVAKTSFERLEQAARSAVRETIPKTEGEGGVAVLNAFFLVARDAVDPFRAELTGLVREHEPSGFRYEFTGPWPPYHFVGAER